MSTIDALLALPPFGVDATTKATALSAAVAESLTHHYQHCTLYRKWCEKHGFVPGSPLDNLAAVPYLPVGIFKRLELSSSSREDVVRVLTSSATSSQIPSRIVIDETTRNRQLRALAAIMTAMLGGRRRPFVILDAPPAANNQHGQELSARAAGMRGYLMAATAKHYVFSVTDSNLALDAEKLLATLEQLSSSGEPFCILGYTYMLYQHAVRPLYEQGVRLKLPENVFVLHFGGWKKLADQAVDRATLNGRVADVFGIRTENIRDVYGFTEQLGVIYPDRGNGIREVPTYSEVLVRDPRTLEVLPEGETGLLEFVCPLPHSYPGVAILLDDLGRIATRHSMASGGLTKEFEVLGRVAKAELRGCGDTLPSQLYSTDEARPDQNARDS